MRLLTTGCLLAIILLPAQAADHTSRSCLTHETRQVLEGLESYLGEKVNIVATCVRKAMAGDPKRMSEHSFGRAVDLKTGLKAKALEYLKTHAHLVMTYSWSSHIHFDMGPYHKVILGSAIGAPRRQPKTYYTHNTNIS